MDDAPNYPTADYALASGTDGVSVTLMIHGMLFTVMMDPDDVRRLAMIEQQKRRRRYS